MEVKVYNSVSKIEIVDILDEQLVSDLAILTIKASDVWDKTKGEDTSIAIIDTGVDVSHPDIENKIKSKFNMINKNRDVADENGHGTHVAGLLVGDLTGVAPEASLHVIKVLNKDGKGSIKNVMEGITHAMNLKVDVLCISLGLAYEIPLILKQRITEAYDAGVTIVSAVGNTGRPEPFYPARMKEVIAVGGLDSDLKIAQFSNGGYDVLAPSTNILSTYKDHNYARCTGTSMASPLVAGAIALLKSHYRKQGVELKNAEIRELLKGKKLDLTELIK